MTKKIIKTIELTSERTGKEYQTILMYDEKLQIHIHTIDIEQIRKEIKQHLINDKYGKFSDITKITHGTDYIDTYADEPLIFPIQDEI